MKTLVLGATSLVGSHFVASKRGAGIEAVDIEDPRQKGLQVEKYVNLDLSREDDVRELIRTSPCDAVVNFVARTDVDGCEKERPLDTSSPAKKGSAGSAWRLNGELPGWLAEETAMRDMFLIHLSTDFVFDGSSGPYREDALPDPLGPQVSWYGYTKGLGEVRVLAANDKGSALIRLSYPYRSQFQGKLDFARNLVAKHKEGKLYPLYSDQKMTPTWIPDITNAIEALLSSKAAGVYHVASPIVTTPYEFAKSLFTELGLDTGALRSSQLKGKTTTGVAPRPLIGGLEVKNVRSLGVEPKSYLEGIRTLAREVSAGSRMEDP
jgi:dTDP-4-dehydrorhamnose reductase